MIKKLQLIVPLFALAILLGGCPYASQVPIDKPSVKVSETLLGKWEPKDENGDKVTVTKKDAYTYNFEKKSSSSGNTTNYEGFISKIGEDQFLNITELGGLSQDYYFFKLVFNKENTKVTLMPITENIDETFKTSAELKAFIEKYKALSFFFGKDEEEYHR